MMEMLPVLLAGGGVAYVAAKGKPAPPPGPQRLIAPPSGSTLSQQQLGITRAITPSITALKTNVIGLSSPTARTGSLALHTVFGVGSHTSYNPSASSDPALQQKLDAIDATLKAKYNELTSTAKAEAARALNKSLNLSPPLTGKESYEQVAGIVGGAAGAAAGAAVCGAACGKLGAMAGAYLGAKIEDLCAKEYPELKAWLSSHVVSQVKDAINTVESKVKSAASSVSHFFGSLF